MNDSILANLFNCMDVTVMERLDDGSFRLLGTALDWFKRLFWEYGSRNEGLSPGKKSPFLENFLIDAENFWAAETTGRLSSGLWLETDSSGNDYALEATAVAMGRTKILLIELARDSYAERQFLIQKGRELTLNRYELETQVKERNAQLTKAVAQLSMLYDISSELNSTTDFETLLKFIIQKTKYLLNVESASIFLWDQRRGKLHLPISQGEETKSQFQPGQLDSLTPSHVANWVFNEGKPALVLDMSADERFREDINRNVELTPAIESVLCIPLRSEGKILGVLEAINKKEGEFTEDEQNLLQTMADNIAVSIEKAQLYEGLQKAEQLLRQQNARLRQSVKQKYRFENIIGNSNKIADVIKKAEQIALTDSTVLIYGETGTGKELLAHAIHQSSPRSSGSFVPINCGAIPENLLESELFGHEKGAFTGAIARRIGRFEEANGGTLLLDEIGDMSLSLQIRLLRILQEGIIQRLGRNEDIPVDIRIVAATHQDLVQLTAEGKFRKDLYYRLKVFELELPSLRERREDIPLLVNHFIKYYSEKLGKQTVSIEDAALNILYHYDYPGNIRELQHIIETAMIFLRGNAITSDVLRKELRISTKSDKELAVSDERIAIPRNNEELKSAKAEAQRRIELLFLTELLSSTRGNISEAARKAGMNRSWLAQLVSKYQLDLSRFRQGVS